MKSFKKTVSLLLAVMMLAGMFVTLKPETEAKAEAVDFILANMDLNLQEACKALGITVEEYDNAKKHLLMPM